MFTHASVPPLIEYPRVSINDKRHYDTPKGKYPSITTILSSTADKTWLEEWRNRVGEAEANRITRNSSNRGTTLHLLCEYYLNNFTLPKVRWDALELFYSIKPLLNRIDNIHHLEGCLFSERLKLAGTVDCVAEFDGVLSIIDFKTSRKQKTEEQIYSYLLQETFYSIAYYELSSISIKQLVTIMAVEDSPPLLFVKKITPEYIRELILLRNRFFLENPSSINS